MNEIERRLSVMADLVTWLDQRIAAQVEHQVEKRLEREREYWRVHFSDMIVEERERIRELFATVPKGIGELVQANCNKAFDRVEEILERSRRAVEQVDASMDRMFRPA